MSSRWYLHLLSMSRCLYGRCLLLSHSSYFVELLPPPMMLSLVPLLGQCGLWYSVHCRIARCRITLFILWSYLAHGFLYPAYPGMRSVCLGLASAFFGLSLMPWSFLVWSLGCISWCPLLLSFWWSCIFRCLLSPFLAISRRFVIRARVGDDILNLCGLLIAFTLFVG